MTMEWEKHQKFGAELEKMFVCKNVDGHHLLFRTKYDFYIYFNLFTGEKKIDGVWAKMYRSEFLEILERMGVNKCLK